MFEVHVINPTKPYQSIASQNANDALWVGFDRCGGGHKSCSLFFRGSKSLLSAEERCVVLVSVISPIDGKSMESISSTKMFQKSEYKENGKIIRWTEVWSGL